MHRVVEIQRGSVESSVAPSTDASRRFEVRQDIFWPNDFDFFDQPKCLDTEVVLVRSDKNWDEEAQL